MIRLGHTGAPLHRAPLEGERGITLMEVAVVGVLAAIVMLALTGFYINSQGTWIDASAQAITQRETSLLVEAITDSVHRSASATSLSSSTLQLQDPDGAEICRFWLEPSDSLIHVGKPSKPDQGPLVRSTTTRFDFWVDSSMVSITALELRSGSGRTVRVATGAAFFNK